MSIEHVASGRDATALYDSYEALFDAAQYLDKPLDSTVSSLLGRSTRPDSGTRSSTLGPVVHHRSHVGLNGDTEVHVSHSRRITSRVTGTDSYTQLTQLRSNDGHTTSGFVPGGGDGAPTNGNGNGNGNGSGPSSLSRSYSEYEFSRNSTLRTQPQPQPQPQPQQRRPAGPTPAPASARPSNPPQSQQPATLTQLVDIEHELTTLTKSLEATYPSTNGGTSTPLLQPNRPTTAARPSAPVANDPATNTTTKV